jgi:hypothetical protein
MEAEIRAEEKKLSLRLGEFMPEFEAVMTLSRILLSDFKGSETITFSPPGDLTLLYSTYSIIVEV